MKLFLPLIVLSAMLLFSCGVVQYATVPINYSAKLYLRPDSTTVVLINQFNADSSGLTNKKKIAVLKSGSFTAITTAAGQLNQLPHTRTIILVDSANLIVNKDSVKSLAARYRADYVLALKKFSAGIGLSEVGNGTAYYDTQTTVNFILYEANGIYYKKLNGTASDPHSEEPYVNFWATLLIHPTIKGNANAVNSSAAHAAQNAFNDYFPSTVTHTRPLFTDDYLQASVKETLAGNLDKADSLLQPYLKAKEAKVVSRAAYNLAVVYETEGDIDAAIDMANLSLEKWENSYATLILNDLKKE